MTKFDDQKMQQRHNAIFKAGAEAAAPSPAVFEGRELGGNETCTFYDGYASTHPEFKNPYCFRR